jgi:perosamine synthetase
MFGSIFGLEEAAALVNALLEKDDFSHGEDRPLLERELAEYLGVSKVWAVHTACSAISIATQLLRLGPGDEVITTPITYIATNLFLLKVGAVPVFADVDPRTLEIDPDQIAELITDRTKAIYVSSYDGQMPDMDPILGLAAAHGLYLFSDVARAVGAEYRGRKAGSMADMAAFSFQTTKNMSTGEGGAIAIRDNDRWAEEALLMRSVWGIQSEVAIEDEMLGDNYRMGELRAALARVQLRRLDRLNEMRRENSHYLSGALAEIEGVTPPYEDPRCKHIFHLYCPQIDSRGLGISRDDFLRVLRYEEGIRAGQGNMPNYLYPYYRIRGYPPGLCPIAEEKWRHEMFTLPMHPALTRQDLDIMVEAVVTAIQKAQEGDFPDDLPEL